MKKATKKVVDLREKEEKETKQIKWDVMIAAPSMTGVFEVCEVVADGFRIEGDEDCIVFWKGDSFDDSDEVAIFKDWIYAIKKPSI